MDDADKQEVLQAAGRVPGLRRGLEELFATPSRDAILNKVARCRGVVLLREKVSAVVASYLDHENWEVRQGAVLGLAELKGRSQLPRIESRLEDPHPRVRANSLQVVAELAGTASAARVAERLADPDPGVRRAALGALVELEADPALVRPLLQRGDAGSRAVVLEALELLGDRASAAQALEFLRDPDPQLRIRAIRYLSRLGREAPVETVLGCATDPELGVRNAAWELLPRTDPRSIARARDLLRHPDPAIRLHAAYTLPSAELPATLVPQVAAALDQADERLALQAALIVESLAGARWERVDRTGRYPEVVAAAREWWRLNSADPRWSS